MTQWKTPFENIMGQELQKAAHNVKTTPINSCHWNCTIQKVRFINTLKYNSERELLHIERKALSINNIKRKLLTNKRTMMVLYRSPEYQVVKV